MHKWFIESLMGLLLLALMWMRWMGKPLSPEGITDTFILVLIGLLYRRKS